MQCVGAEACGEFLAAGMGLVGGLQDGQTHGEVPHHAGLGGGLGRRPVGDGGGEQHIPQGVDRQSRWRRCRLQGQGRAPPPIGRTRTDPPVQVVKGVRAGRRVFLCAELPGDEINGVEIIRRVLRLSALKRLKGTLVALPIVMLWRRLPSTTKNQGWSNLGSSAGW